MTRIALRSAQIDDLPALNHVVEAAFMTWDLPERVKRLSLQSYLYDEMDLQHLQLELAERNGQVVGVAAWEEAAGNDCPQGARGLLLHGLYVLPEEAGRGIGRRLLEAARAAAAEAGLDGVVIKAQTDAVSFFEHLGLQALAIEDIARHYAKRFWLAV